MSYSVTVDNTNRYEVTVEDPAATVTVDGTGSLVVEVGYDDTAALAAVAGVGNGALVNTAGATTAVAGSNGQFLKHNGTTWAAGAGYSDANAVDAIEAIGNGVLVTTGGTAAAVTGSNGQALVHNGTTWVAGTAGFTNPMTTIGDLIYASASGTPATASRLGIGNSYDILGVTAASGMTYCPQVAGFGRMPARYSLAIADGNGTPVMFGWTTAVTRTQSSSTNGARMSRLCGISMHRQGTSASANQWAGWSFAIVPTSTTFPYGSATAMVRPDETASSAYAYGLIVGAALLQGATGPFLNAAPTGFKCYGLRWRTATQTTWHLIMYDGSTFTETDTGVTVTANSNATATDGTTHGLVVGRDASGVWWEIWDELTSPPTRLGSGRTSSGVPSSIGNVFGLYAGFGSNGASAYGQVNLVGFTALSPGGPF